MDKFRIITGKKLTEEIFQKTWELDNQTFDKSQQITENMSKMFFANSNGSPIVLWNDTKDELVGYLSPFLMRNEFFENYINSDKSFKKIKPSDFYQKGCGSNEANIYIFSSVIKLEYRDRPLTDDKKSKYYNKPAMQILNEAMVDWICELKKTMSLNYIFSEKVSDDGEKYLRSMRLEPCFALKDDCKFAVIFNPSCFSKCSNINKLYEMYRNDNVRGKYKPEYLAGHDYLSFKNNCLYFRDINLYDLAKKYGAPLEIAYLDIIGDRIKYLKNIFAQKIAKHKYQGSYKYAYATKANYYSETVITAHKYVDFLETSSAYDIDIIIDLAKKGIIKKGYTVICNGFKNDKYVRSINELLKMKINVIPIIENSFEIEKLSKIEYKFNVGIRYNSDFESRLIKNNFKDFDEFDNRFGFDKFNIEEICKKISKNPNMTLQVFHFHFGGTITNIDNYVEGLTNIFDIYCQLKKQFPTFKYFDFGGGFPIKYALTYKFDYEKLIDKMVYAVKTLATKRKIEMPDLIGEHGRFTVGDSGFMIYKVDFTKELNHKFWYILNTSLMNMTPDMWGIKQDFTILPVNFLERKTIPVCLGGETCDPDDRYFLNDNNVKLFMPELKKNEELYVAIFSTGAYQDIISGISGAHHCLIPEGKELIIYTDKKGEQVFYEVQEKQTSEEILAILDYKDKKHIKRFL